MEEIHKDIVACYLYVITKHGYPPVAAHADPNLAGAVINTRLRHKKGKLWIIQRDVGTTFGVRFLASYYNYTFGISHH
jgi:hypothetical protein